MTTTDPTNQGRLAAIRRPVAGVALAACLCALASPAFADSVAPAIATPPATTSIVPAALQSPATGTPRTSTAMQDSAVLLAGDLNRLMGSHGARTDTTITDAGTGGRIQSEL